jgi:uracil-DNA glycosylase
MENRLDPVIEASWKEILEGEFQQPYFIKLKEFLVEEKKSYQVFPPGKLIFAAFDYTPFKEVKVVILGQDPYHGPGQAHGLCFSVPDGISFPPSLRNIFKELRADLCLQVPMSGNLEKWAKNGVLLLNATLTVRTNQAGAHQNKGWEIFTDRVIKTISNQKCNVVFILWGNYAIAKKNLIDENKHCVFTAAHPSPFSADRGFFGCRHFSKTNKYLADNGLGEINWDLY